MSPVLIAGQTRMVLNWGETPPDLGSHVLTPIIDGSTHHIYFSNPAQQRLLKYPQILMGYTGISVISMDLRGILQL